MSDVLFVYGTLKRGGRNAAFVSAHQRAEAATTRGRLYALREGYPALVEASDGEVQGEALFFSDLARYLPALDDLEGFLPHDPGRSLFLRSEREIRLSGNGTILLASAYSMPAEREPELIRQGARRMSDGVWRGEHEAFEQG